VPVLRYSNKVLRALITNCKSTPSAMMLSIEKIKRRMTNKTGRNFFCDPNWSLTYLQKFYPHSISLRTKLYLRFPFGDGKGNVKLAGFVSVLARRVLHFNLKS
jgi:hypothetical protein